MSYFKVELFEDRLHVVFSPPKAEGNSFSLAAARELSSVVKEHWRLQKPVVVSSGHPWLFCSGGNLSDYAKTKTKAQGLKINKQITAVLDRFARWPAVKIAFVEGDVLGGGMEWLSRFDYSISHPAVAFAFLQSKLGLSTGWGGGAIWSRRIGEEATRRMLIEARPMFANEAFSVGLVNAVVPRPQMRAHVQSLLSHISAIPARELLQWSAKAEEQVMQDLWFNQKHKLALHKWRTR